MNGKTPKGVFWCDINVLYFIMGGGYMGMYKCIIVNALRTENLKPVHFIVCKFIL